MAYLRTQTISSNSYQDMFSTINPYSGASIEAYPAHQEADIAAALDAATVAWQHWRKRPVAQRTALIRQLGVLLRMRKDVLARQITLEMGKLFKESVAEVEKSALCCDFYADHAAEFLAEERVAFEHEAYIRREPVGAILAVMPWNFPVWQVIRYAVPALAAGNVTLLKHAPNVFGCATMLEDLFADAGFPKGTFQSLRIGVEMLDLLVRHPIVQGCTLTGSEAAGSSFAALAGRHLKKSVLELGGSDPFIVLADADLRASAKIAVFSRLMNAGQSCISAKRFIVEDAVHDAWVEQVVKAVAHLRTGDPLDSSTQLAPLARPDLALKLRDQVTRAQQAGAKSWLPIVQEGTHFQPVVLTEVHIGSPAFEEELFGPVFSVIRASDAADAIRLANASPYGLGATLWTQDREQAREMAGELLCGAVCVNTLMRSDPRLPFGGVRRSGYGRELGREGLLEFTAAKSVVLA